MKKILFLIFAIITYAAFAAVKLNAWNGHYSIPCPKCKELTLGSKKGYSYCLGCPMWRCYAQEGKDYMIYRCQHGHKILIPKSTNKKTNELSEVLVEDVNGNRKGLNLSQ